jgi:hypothetical protein
MKRIELIRHLENEGCEFLRQGVNHAMHVKSKGAKIFRKSGGIAK